MKQAIVVGKSITKWYSEASSPVLDKVNIDLYKGDFTVLMGASGAGKSTLLYALSGMNRMDSGEVYYQDKNIVGYSEKQMARLRSESFGFVFQQTHLVSNLTLLENVVVAGYLNTQRSMQETNQKANNLLQQMHVEHAMHRLPSNVSGGEGQRAAIARAMINDPAMLFADEPTGALNRRHSDEVLTLLKELHTNGQSILMATHDLHAAAQGTRILYMQDGNIVDEIDLSLMAHSDHKEKEAYVSQWLTSHAW